MSDPISFGVPWWPTQPYGDPGNLKAIMNMMNAAFIGVAQCLPPKRTAVDDIMDRLREDVHVSRMVELLRRPASPNGWKAMQV